MDYYHGWTVPLAERMDSQTQPTNPFAANISSYFRRPARVVKPNGRNNSPRNLSRRKTTTTIPAARIRPVLDNQHTSLPKWPVQPQGRPLSWHPTTYSQLSPANGDYQFHESMSANQYSTAAVNGLITPMSYPMMDEPQIQELVTPLEELLAHEVESGYNNHFSDGQYWASQENHKAQTYPGLLHDGYYAGAIPQYWQCNNQSTLANVPTAPSSPYMLPIQGGNEQTPLVLATQNLNVPAEGEELVAMGLYDSPADVQSSSLFGGLPTPTVRKSLKLEDSFTPEQESDDADQAEQYDGPAETPEDSPVAFPAYHEQYINNMSNLSGQSFFFDQEPDTGPLNLYTPDTSYMTNDGYATTEYNGYGWI